MSAVKLTWIHRAPAGRLLGASLPIAVGVLLLLVGSACSKSVNPVASNMSYGPNDRFATRILDSSEQAKVISIMQESVTGPTNDQARPAKYGVRWRDVGLAASKASIALELAVVSVDEEEDGTVKRIHIITVTNQPVELVVRKVDPPEIYEATATAGLFEDRTELADRLLSQFHDAMRAYGAKPSWPDLPND